jgi:hypothetical protein
MKTKGGVFARSQAALDAASRRRIRIFTVKLLVVIPVAIAFAIPRGYSPFKVLAFFCGWQSLFAGAAALFQRQQLDSSRLTGWDEMAAFMGIAELARLVAAIAS